MGKIEVVDYDPTWPRHFEELRARIWPVVQDFAFSIEHVGSTSVPGLAAKPIIDLDIVIPSEAQLPLAVQALASLGYQHQGNLGIKGREAFRRPEGTLPHNLYVCPKDSEGLHNHLALRDYLRANPEAVRSYAELKKQLAQQFPQDIEGYVDGKTDFILRILKQQGLSSERLDSIEAGNRKN